MPLANAANAQGFQVIADYMAGFSGVAGEREAEAVEQRAFTEMHHVTGDAPRLRASDKTGDFGSEGNFFGHDDFLIWLAVPDYRIRYALPPHRARVNLATRFSRFCKETLP